MKFAEASAVEGGNGSWTAQLAEGWDIFGVTNGGYLMAIAARAMGNESGGRTLISATGSFMNPASAGPVSIRVEVLKRGRSLSTLRATIARDDKDLVYVTGVYSDPERPVSDADLVTETPPDLPPPNECVPVEPAGDAPIPPPFSGKIEIRTHPDDAAALMGPKSEKPRIRGWFRLRDDEPLDAFSVVMAVDAFPPAIFNSRLTVGWTPTIDLTVQVRNPTPTGWLGCVFTTQFVTDGMLEEDGRLWDESGRIVALSRQLALVPR